MEKQPCIYMIFSATPVKMGAIIRKIIRNQYNHVSIALEKDAKHFYAFARYRLYSPLAGGFIIESRERFFAESGAASKIKVMEIPVSDATYQQVKMRLAVFEAHKGDYIYNTFSAVLLPFGKVCRIKNSYTCSEFAADILIHAGLLDESARNKPATIQSLEKQFCDYLYYEGEIPDLYGCSKNRTDLYFRKQNPFEVFAVTARHFYKLISKLFFLRQ